MKRIAKQPEDRALSPRVTQAEQDKWREEYAEPLRGKRVVIIADADEPGRKHAQQIAASVSARPNR